MRVAYQVQISLVMIMRDAAMEIEACLSSCAQSVDEIILCDTGSRDGSVRRAKKFLRNWQEHHPGARFELLKFKWRDDFAAARNYALDRAHGEWALLLDCDERLVEKRPGELRALVRELSADALPSGCTLSGPYSGGSGAPDVLEFLRHNIDLEGRDVEMEPDDLAVRLARLDRGLRYKGAVHEELSWRSGRELRAASVSRERVYLLHTGYRDSVKQQKLDRNYGILQRQLEQGGSTLGLDYYLADMYMAKGDFARAIAHAENMLAGRRPVHDPFVPYRVLYQAHSNLAKSAVGKEQKAYIERRTEEVIARGLAEFPTWPDFYYFRGVRRWNEGKEDEGLSDLETCARLAADFPNLHPLCHDGFVGLRPALYEALEQAYTEKGELEKAHAARQAGLRAKRERCRQ